MQYIASGIMVGGVYSLIALGIVLINKSTGVFNFAVGQLMMFGAYFFWTFSVVLSLHIWISLLLALLATAILCILIERFALQPLIGQPVLSAILVTLALSYALNGISLAIWGSTPQRAPAFLPGSNLSIGGVVFANDLLWSFCIAMGIFVLLYLFYQKTKAGLAMRATAESHQIAQARGINVVSIFALTWAIAGILAAVGGILLANRLGVNQLLSHIGLKAFPVVLFGGLESIGGAIIAGLIVGVLENLAGGYIATWLMEITPYIVLLIVLIFRPEGLFGQKRIERI